MAIQVTSTRVSERVIDGEAWLGRRDRRIDSSRAATSSGAAVWRGSWNLANADPWLVDYWLSWAAGSSNLVASAEFALRQIASDGILVRDPLPVRDYLVAHPDVIDATVTICERAKFDFGGDTQVSLEVYSDPEIDDKHLVLYVRQFEYRPGLLDSLEKFTLRVSPFLTRTSGWLLVTTDYAPPGSTP